MNSQEYIEVSLKITPFEESYAEIMMALLEELPFESFVSEDPYLKCYIQKDDFDAHALKVVLSGADDFDFEVKPSWELIPAKNWNEVWESNFDPCYIATAAGRVVIKAPFHKDLKRCRFNVTINPQMAFGTGHHQTTHLMVRGLLAAEERVRGGVVMDLGCGTAVLAILAQKMGAKKSSGIDLDAVAVVSARENVALNRFRGRIDIAYGDASRLQRGTYDVLLANINRNILIQDMDLYAKSLRKGGLLITSGYYTDDMPALVEAAERNGLRYHSHEELDQWCSVKFEK